MMSNVTGILKGRWTLWIVALGFSLLAGAGALSILGQAADRVTYYVLNQAVAEGVKITPDMLAPREAPADGVPDKSLTPSDFQNYELYSVAAFEAGTVMQNSMVTMKNSSLTSELPAGFVLASVLVEPQNAAGGRVAKGDFVDIAVAATGGNLDTAKIVMQHVKVMDVTVAPESIAEAAANRSKTMGTPSNGTALADQPALYSGIPSMYLLAVSAKDFVKLALIHEKSLYLAISATQTPSSLNVSDSLSSILQSGDVTPSFPLTATAKPASSAIVTPGTTTQPTPAASSASGTVATATPKQTIEAFYANYKAKGTYNFAVANGYLQVIDPSTKKSVDSISLAGGKFDIPTGVWTAP